jgi:endonuclease YncB( thermonuclease family)
LKLDYEYFLFKNQIIISNPNMGQCKSLHNFNNDNIKDFTYDGKFCRAKIVHIYDGDTGRIVFRDSGTFRKYKFRLYGIDTPELKPRLTTPNREEIVSSAKKARDFVIQKVLNRIVYIRMYGFDKYGRILIDIYPEKNKMTLTQMLIDKKFGVEYFGGKKN